MATRKKIKEALKEISKEERSKTIENIGRAIPQEQFEEIVDRMVENTLPLRTLMAYYQCAIMEVETKFRVLDQQFSLQYDANPIESIKTRIKSEVSLAKKLKKNGLPFTTEAIENNIHDVAGVRIITSFEEDIYLLADCLLQQDDIILIEKKDYIKNPKPNGYRSLHLIIEVPIFLQNEKRNMKVEVQLRTIAMDFWAALDHRLRYKKNLTEELQKEIAADLLECANVSASLDQKMQNVYNRIEKEK